MIQIKIFVFNPFQVNTYILSDETGKAVIIDPACYGKKEEKELESFLTENKLEPVLSLNTHTHVDHILGNNFIWQKFGLKSLMHQDGVIFAENASHYGSIYGFELSQIVLPDRYLQAGEILTFGNSRLKVLHTPGHVNGHVCFYNQAQDFAIVGDVIFYESIGRTDLPTGNYKLLVQSITDQLFTLNDITCLYPGHGHETTVEHEKKFNPFLNGSYFEE
ncbi:MAG: MBL fold metallo-hydrolase [Bacteroidales bacterium]